MEKRDEPPQSLQLLAVSLQERLTKLGLRHTTRFSPPTEVNNWRLSVSTDDDEEDFIFGAHGVDTIGVIPAHQEDVSVSLATEYVLMSLGLTTEEAWWEAFRAEQAAQHEARRAIRRAWWRARLGLRG